MRSLTLILLNFLTIALNLQFCNSSGHTNNRGYRIHTDITAKNFQKTFLENITNRMDVGAQKHLDLFLNSLKRRSKYNLYHESIDEILQSNKLEHKILFIKQLLDFKEHENDKNNSSNNKIEEDMETFYIIRNVNFLKKFKHQLREMQNDVELEFRQLHMFTLCQQFYVSNQNSKPNQTTITSNSRILPYSEAIKLAPINEQNIHVPLQKLTPTSTQNATIIKNINLLRFGRKLYGRVKAKGEEIIDDYLNSVRHLLLEVTEDKPEYLEQTEVVTKFVKEIDTVLQMNDLYQKRQQIYAYLQSNLINDYERFDTSNKHHEDLAEILAKLKEKGLDFFVTFLFSNFEFLEYLHDEMYKMLMPKATATTSIKTATNPTQTVKATTTATTAATGTLMTTFDDNGKLLYEIHQRYVDFKMDTESFEKYDTYIVKVNQLHTKTMNNATEVTQNVGDAALNANTDDDNIDVHVDDGVGVGVGVGTSAEATTTEYDGHIYELLLSASQNVGSVMMHIIKGKCNML